MNSVFIGNFSPNLPYRSPISSAELTSNLFEIMLPHWSYFVTKSVELRKITIPCRNPLSPATLHACIEERNYHHKQRVTDKFSNLNYSYVAGAFQRSIIILRVLYCRKTMAKHIKSLKKRPFVLMIRQCK